MFFKMIQDSFYSNITFYSVGVLRIYLPTKFIKSILCARHSSECPRSSWKQNSPCFMVLGGEGSLMDQVRGYEMRRSKSVRSCAILRFFSGHHCSCWSGLTLWGNNEILVITNTDLRPYSVTYCVLSKHSLSRETKYFIDSPRPVQCSQALTFWKNG